MIYSLYFKYCYYCVHCYYWQVCVDLGIADHIWKEKHAAIAKKPEVDDMGDQFRPAMLAGWLAYITKTYPKDTVTTGSVLGQGELVVPDEDA